MKPRDGREMALKFLFSSEFKKTDSKEDQNYDSNEKLLNKLLIFRKSFKASDEVWNFVTKIISAYEMNHLQIDSKIKDQLKNWKVERLSFTDKNILRIALTEMLYLDLKPKIAINEAIELSKKCSNLESGSFINGVLDSLTPTDQIYKGAD